MSDDLTYGELRDLPDDDPRKEQALEDLQTAITDVCNAIPEASGDTDD